MDIVLYRYWILPSRWRRWPIRVRLLLALGLVAVSLSLGLIPLCIWLPHQDWQGFDGFGAFFCGIGFLSMVDLFAGLAGATLLAGERDRGTWESLQLTPLGTRCLVRIKLICRCLLCGMIAALTLPFWLGWAYEVLAVNNTGPFDRSPELAFRVAVRMTIFLIWLAVRITGRVIPFVALGMATSARSRSQRNALAITAIVVIAIQVGAYFAAGPLGSLLHLWSPHLPLDPLNAVLWWPLIPNDFSYYSMTGLLSSQWRADMVGDVVWLGALPYLFYRLAVRWSRRPTKSRDMAAIERGAHGF